MKRVLTLCAIAAALIAPMLLLKQKAEIAQASEAFMPSCPQTHYYADGNVGPLFCVINNPIAVRFYASLGKRTFALGPGADPRQVYDALMADSRHDTEPELCAVYQLAAWKNHWQFGSSPMYEAGARLHYPSDWCREPSFDNI